MTIQAMQSMFAQAEHKKTAQDRTGKLPKHWRRKQKLRRGTTSVLGRIYVFFTLFGYQVGGGGSPKGRVHNLLMQFVTLGSSKMEVFETCFCDIVIT